MIRSAVTISLVPEARGGPFIFWDDLAEGCRKARALGFDAIELFAPDAEAIRGGELRRLLNDFGLKLAAAGTGAGWVKHKLTLTSGEAAVRRRATDFVRSIIDAAGELGAPAIIGSMARWFEDVARDEALAHLQAGLRELGAAAPADVGLLIEPLNRYETKLFNTLAEGAAFVDPTTNVKLLADLFHMNIEEANPAAALRAAGPSVGHVHFADSNRRALGFGHTDMAPVVAALRDIGYDGYVSAEALPHPTPDEAARQTIESFRKFFR